jgi:hypothetical protein
LQFSTSPSTSGFIVWKWTNFVFFQTWSLDNIHSTLTCVSPFYWRHKSKQNVKCKNMTEQCHQSVTEQPSSCKCVFKWRRSGTFLCDLV